MNCEMSKIGLRNIIILVLKPNDITKEQIIFHQYPKKKSINFHPNVAQLYLHRLLTYLTFNCVDCRCSLFSCNHYDDNNRSIVELFLKRHDLDFDKIIIIIIYCIEARGK